MNAMPDLKPLDMTAMAAFYPESDKSRFDSCTLGLGENRSVTTEQKDALTAVLDRAKNAVQVLGRIPDVHQAIHCVLKGTVSLFDFVPAVLQLSRLPIDRLLIATLSFSKRNVEDLADLVAAGQVQTVATICSHYFKAKNAQIYEHMAGFCAANGFQLVAMRAHAKLLLIAAVQHRLVVESSANLRSCNNVEQATLFNDPTLYDFHRAWMEELIEQGKDANDATRPKAEASEPAEAPRKPGKTPTAARTAKGQRRAADVPGAPGTDSARGVGPGDQTAGPSQARPAGSKGRAGRLRDGLAALG